MAKMTMNELKLEIAEILHEAKKKVSKADKLKKKGASVEAYGLYDEAFDFSQPLGAYNYYRRQGASNFGPYTAAVTSVDASYHNPNPGALQMKESEEHALRALVREVIENGLVPSDSAWAPIMERRQQMFESSWAAADHLFEAWYDQHKKKSAKSSASTPKKDDSEHKYGAIKKHGFEKKKGKK